MARLAYEELTGEILAAACEVHSVLGCGYAESVYELAMEHELGRRGLKVKRQAELPVQYKDVPVGKFFADMVVNDTVLIELKATAENAPVFVAQVLNYLKASNLPVGLLLNFGMESLYRKRFVSRSLLNQCNP
ncbi:MAG: hypothetical protein BIFFINMI_03540 [Phycisphaerae bacterium]|nr:hypothetical protein [Phycisphaerae bacterium]